MDKVELDRYERAIDTILVRANETDAGLNLLKRGEQLRWRLRKGGIQREPILVITAQKKRDLASEPGK